LYFSLLIKLIDWTSGGLPALKPSPPNDSAAALRDAALI